MKNIILYLFLTIMITSCANTGTPPSQITGTYVSPLKYKKYSCDELSTELSSLSRRENALETAQKSRIESNNVQAFWLGYGRGDGVEASELASVKGEREAVRSAMEKNNCTNRTSSLNK